MAAALLPPSRSAVFGLFVALLAVGGGCGGGGESRRLDASGGSSAGGGSGGSAGGSIGVDGGLPDRPSKQIGEPCATGSECGSANCVEGVCCNEACDKACFTCKNAGTEGTCLPSYQGTDPGDRCPSEAPTTCGTTGVCDGTGACERYSGNAGVVCAAEACVGFMRTTTGTCDNQGGCSGAATVPCTPFQCATDGKTCRTTCTSDADCVAPNSCINSSCGKKPIGASCGAGGECNSNICAQGRCCSADCAGTCKSCAVPGSEGTCRNVPDGQDLHGHCADGSAATCGLDGQCDGTGMCRKYAVGTVCGMDSCSMGAERVAGRCDAAGTCAPGMLRSCSPYVCGVSNCLTRCTTNADCVTGFSCVGNVCVQKSNGATCANAGECISGYCEQGVCCNDACSATCRSCALAGSVGTCTNVANGTAPTPATQCADMGASSCGTDGRCNGSGACRNYTVGTNCGAASCSGSTLSSPRSCDGMGTCRAATTSSCAPYQCGTGACKMSCSSTAADCTTGNTCVAMSCGKIPIGGSCPSGINSDCASNFCVNNVCCNRACTETCMSCTLTGSVGTCSPIASGDPPLSAAQCPAAAASTCGNDGNCDGAGACRRHVSGTQCAAPTCTGSTATSARLCNGAGVCAAATTTSCGRYTCETTAPVCRTGCTADADCVAPNICNANACTLKPTGRTCTNANECDSNFCAQGYCCNQACTGTCRSCAIAGSLGTCSNVGNGVAPTPATQCAATVSSTCGLDGMCNGSGACRYWATGTQCAAGTCVGSTLTPQRTCDGAGVCRSVTSTLCDPYQCASATACKSICATAAADCVAPNSCINMSCGKLPNGAPCTIPGECNSNQCAQGVCCSTACAGTCVSCALTGSVGTCASAPAGQDPLDQCADQGVSTCGTDGSCNGSGACRRYASGTVCVAASCATASSVTPNATCNTSGTCVTPANVNCVPYACASGVCRTSCAATADCSGPPYVCLGTTCTSATNLTVRLQSPTAATVTDKTVEFQMTNNGTTAVPLSDLTVRYWYTYDATTPPANCSTVVAQTAACYFTTLPGGCNTAGSPHLVFSPSSFVAVNPPRTNADRYFQLGFTAAAGNLNPGATTHVLVQFHKNDWCPFTQANDYSYNGSSSFMTTTRVTVYRVGVLVYGAEPP